jgi:hypothetical protein
LWWRNSSLFGAGKLMSSFVSWHKKIIKRWGKILNISDYGMLWVAFIKGVIIGLLIYHFFIK